MSDSRRDFLKRAGMAAAAPMIGVGRSQPPLAGDLNSGSASDPDHIASVVYDLAVLEATPGGIACAVRAAREGLHVLLVNRAAHLGGMISGGIGVLDAMYGGKRATFLDEFQQRVLEFYRAKYGEDSLQYQAARPGPRLAPDSRLSFEPSVGEAVLNAMVSGEKNITVLKGYYPAVVDRSGRIIRSVTLASEAMPGTVTVSAKVFVDASYTADLAAVAGVEYRVGREDRNQFNEPHAGRIFTLQRRSSEDHSLYPRAAVTGGLNLRPVSAVSGETFAGSTGEGDTKIEAWNYRLCVSRDPSNRRYPEQPPGYNRQEFIDTYSEDFPRIGKHLINQKTTWWENLTVANYAYPDGHWPTRHKIEARYRDYALGRMYFLQNDPWVTEKRRQEARQWGLAKDEFVDNQNFPYQLYIREARRIVGRYIFKEQDATFARGYERTPVQDDSIAITDWYIDLQQVSRERQLGSSEEGLLSLSELARPAQIPYRTLLPKDIDNLLVIVCISTTHVGWGAVRLEPTWMHIGEAAGFAAAHARQRRVNPALIRTAELQRVLADRRMMMSFFNDFDMGADAAWVPAVNDLATKGFFDSYNARPNDPLLSSTAVQWAAFANEIAAGQSNGDERARRLAASAPAGAPVPAETFAQMFDGGPIEKTAGASAIRTQMARQGLQPGAVLRRGDACLLVYRALALG